MLYSFDCSTEGCAPFAALIEASDGNFYGTTVIGPEFGEFGNGTVFKLTPDGSLLTTLHAFAFDCDPDGCSPQAALIEANHGNFYRTTVGGPGDRGGTVFKLTPEGVFTTLHAFDCSSEGCFPSAGLVEASDGNIYGTTSVSPFSSPFGGGTVFRLTPGGAVTTVHVFACGTEGCHPHAGLIQAGDGRLYGTLSGGGPQGGGAVFRLIPNTLTALGPARVWIGLKNSDDVGVRLDLRAEVYQNGTLIGSGELVSVPGGSSGFNNARGQAVPLASSAPEPVLFGTADTLSITLYVRNACTGIGKNSGTARLWLNDAPANSRFDATTAERTRDYVLRSGFALSPTAGASKQAVGVAVGARCGSFVSFGTWSIVAPSGRYAI